MEPRFAVLLACALAVFSSSRMAAQQCAACHPREAAEHSRSAHAHSLKRPIESNFYRALPDRPIGEARGGFLLSYSKSDDALQVTASRGNDTASALIAWIFGAGRQAETPVAITGSIYVEHRISYYSANGRFNLTIGHPAGISRSAREALGRTEKSDEAGKCFGCHATGGLPGESSFQPGVQCERCHAGAQEHAQHRIRNESGPAPDNPGRLNAKALVKFCAACHRDQPEGDPDAPINVRYQAVRLMRSKCFRNGNLSCITCHDPHTNATTDAAFYRDKCLACHADQKNQGDCLACHMPRLSPLPHLTFTDHYIRVPAAAIRHPQ